MACTAITARALFALISLAGHRFFTIALDGQIKSVPLLKKVSLFWALVTVSLLQLRCATVFLFWWLCQHKGLLWRCNKMLSLCSSSGWLVSWPPVIIQAVFIHITYLLTPWSRVLLEKLTGSAASQEIPRIFGTRRFLSVPTSARHLSLSWANSIQSPQLPPTPWRSVLILSSHLRLGW